MADITLTAASRNSLLSLTSTQDLLSRTQNRLTTGLQVEVDERFKPSFD